MPFRKRPLKPAKTSYSRVFITENGARADRPATYEGHMASGGLSRSYGDRTRIEIPSETEYGKFDEIASVRGAIERATGALNARYSSDVRSKLMKIAQRGCQADVHIHFGECTDPRDFDEFSKALILENVYVTSYSSTELGTLASDAQGSVEENVDLSAGAIYEVLPLHFSEVGFSFTVNACVDVVMIPDEDCETGECERYNRIFVCCNPGTGGFVGPAVLYSLDKGVTWQAAHITTLGAGQNPLGIRVIGDYVVVVSSAVAALHIAPLEQFDGTTAPTWTSVTTGFVTVPQAIDSYGRSWGYVSANSGYVYRVGSNPAEGVTVVEAGVATTRPLYVVKILDENIAMAGGQASALIYTVNGETWERSPTYPLPEVVGTDMVCLFPHDEKYWWIGAAYSNLHYTLDGGNTWTRITNYPFSFDGLAPAGAIRDIWFTGRNIVYVPTRRRGSNNRILASYDGGASWKELFVIENLNDTTCQAIAAEPGDPNWLITVGRDNSDQSGWIRIGQSR